MSKKDWNRSEQCLLASEPSYPEVFDTIIIGAGPAGMTASIYSARRKLKTLMICGTIGGQMKWSSDIENWTGVAQATGPELTNQFFAHVKKVDDDNAHFDLWLRENEKVSKVEQAKSKEYRFLVTTNSGKKFKAQTIICTTGKIPRTLGIPGEEIAMKGNGLSFAATSDAPLYRGKKMAVIGGGNSAMDVSLQLSKYTDDITIFTVNDTLFGETCLMERCKKAGIKVKYNVQTLEILLDKKDKVSGLRISEDGGPSQKFECQGVFEEIGQTPATEFLEDLLKLNEGKEIPTNRKCQTEIPGLFAGGDCTDQVHKQVIVAAGEGAIAALEAHDFLLKN